jgi:hypothetical protein
MKRDGGGKSHRRISRTKGLPRARSRSRRTPAAPVREDSAAGWQPSAAAALDSLAEEELAEARSRPPEAAASPFSASGGGAGVVARRGRIAGSGAWADERPGRARSRRAREPSAALGVLRRSRWRCRPRRGRAAPGSCWAAAHGLVAARWGGRGGGLDVPRRPGGRSRLARVARRGSEAAFGRRGSPSARARRADAGAPATPQAEDARALREAGVAAGDAGSRRGRRRRMPRTPDAPSRRSRPAPKPKPDASAVTSVSAAPDERESRRPAESARRPKTILLGSGGGGSALRATCRRSRADADDQEGADRATRTDVLRCLVGAEAAPIRACRGS